MMSLQQAAQWLTDAQVVGDASLTVQRVHTDTRTLAPGDLFIALKGERFDGNDYLAEAKAKGAVAALCQSDAAHAALNRAALPGLVVPDSKQALGELAAGWRQQFKLPLIAVTGSNGKTTVTQMIASILSVFKPQAMLATQGNFNNDIGVPLTLLRLNAKHEAAVVELGMNHPGEIKALADMARPTVALVNNAQREHLEFMANTQAVAQENGAVIETLGDNGVAVFPADDAFSLLWLKMTGARAHMSFAIKHQEADDLEGADVYCAPPVWSNGAWSVRVRTPVGTLSYRLRVAGLHNVKNSLAAVTCALAAGVPLADIARGLEAFEPVKGRSRALSVVLSSGHTLTLVDDSYNANPDSVRAAIDVLAGLPGPRLLVLGDMGEVGQEGPMFHAEVGAYARERGIDALFGLGEQMVEATKAFGAGQHFADVESLNAAVIARLPGLVSVLVKGSRFMKMERVAQAILACAAQPSGDQPGDQKEKNHAA
jgi:UDP-N-acetylmuramoyl-tripeptide--D-alanyl-D-alanine ligase